MVLRSSGLVTGSRKVTDLTVQGTSLIILRNRNAPKHVRIGMENYTANYNQLLRRGIETATNKVRFILILKSNHHSLKR